MQSWLFVAEVAMLKDALRLLSQLSQYVQNKKANFMEAQSKVSKAVNILCSLKERNGEITQRFIDSFTASKTFKDVQLSTSEREVSSLCKDLGFKAVDILFEYSEYMLKGIMKSKIAPLHRLLNIYPRFLCWFPHVNFFIPTFWRIKLN